MTLFDCPAATNRVYTYVTRDAELSADGQYRYRLRRIWDDGLPILNWCGLNPSTADALVDDPTIGREVAFSAAFGYGGLAKFNMFGWRATDPAGLTRTDDAIGPENDRYLLSIPSGEPLVCAWGASVPHYWRHRPAAIVEQLRRNGVELYHLGLTKDGHPRHPLYLRGDTPLTRWVA